MAMMLHGNAPRLRFNGLIVFLRCTNSITDHQNQIRDQHNRRQDVGDGRTVIRQMIGQSDLAAMTGIARESANRIINDWERRKMISRSSGYYCIENKDQLQREAELSY